LTAFPSIFSSASRQDPYPVYTALRRERPVHHDEVHDVWMVSRYEDVVRVLRDANSFSSKGIASFESVLLGADPPQHARVRQIVSRLFSPQAVARLEDRIQTLANELVERISGRRECDLVVELAAPLPLALIVEVLGLDGSRREDYERWSRAVAEASTDPESSSGAREAERDREEFHRFFDRHVERIVDGSIRESPLSQLLAVDEQDGLTPFELGWVAKLLLIAGTETTTNLIGNGILALLENPTQLERLRAEPELIDSAVEELLRFDPPVQFDGRNCIEETEVGGVTIAKCEFVMTLIGAANRDPEHFEDPDTFDVTRGEGDSAADRHLAFGFGIHRCMGNRLAEMQLRVLWEEIMQRFHTIEVVGQPIRVQSSFVRGYSELPVRLHAIA